MRKLSRLALGALFAGALAIPAAAEDGVTDTEIVLGSHTALSGPVSAWGIGSTEGMRMRFDEANEKGINGRKIKFIVEDHQYQVPRAVQAANKLINNDKIFAMLGALGTPQNNAVLGEQLGKGVPNLFPFTAARSMAEPFHKLKFATFSTYYDQVRSSTKHFVEKEGKKKVCSMYQDTDFGHEIRDGVRDQAKALKLEVVAEASYGPTDTDFVAPVTKLKSAGCDLVVMGSIIRDSIQSVGTAKKLGWTDVTFVGQAASYDPIVAAAPGGIMEGFYSGTGMPFAYADTSSRSDQGLVGEVQGEDRPGRQQRRAVRLRGRRHRRQGAGGDRQGPDARQVPGRARSRSRTTSRSSPGPTLSYGADRHQGSTASFLAKVEGGRWKVVAENLLY